jgi:hypothetical protein
MNLIPWYLKHHSSKLTKDEEEVLSSCTESRFDMFKVISHTDGELKLMDTGGKISLVDIIDMKPMTPEVALFTRINSKEDGRYFLPGPVFPSKDDEMFLKL